LKGEYNVPFGRYKDPKIPVDNILAYHSVLMCGETRLTNCDFEKVIDECGKGDIIYADSPFAPVSATASFVNYSAPWLGEVDLMRLDAALYRAVCRGAVAVASASDTAMSRRAYKHATVALEVMASRTISRNGGGRKPVKELLFVYKGE